MEAAQPGMPPLSFFPGRESGGLSVQETAGAAEYL